MDTGSMAEQLKHSINMKRTVFIILCALCCTGAFAWDSKGHATIAVIANDNIKPSTKKQIEKYLGHSIIYYASWMDQYRFEPEYRFTSYCHVFPADSQCLYAPAGDKPDAVSLLEQAIETVKDRRNRTDSAVVVSLKYIIHLVGDMHCPTHVKYKGVTTKFNVYVNKKSSSTKTAYHSIWDGTVINRRTGSLSPTEVASELARLDKKEIKSVQAGTPRQWADECAGFCRPIYDMAEDGSVLDRHWFIEAWPLARHQLTFAGYRLAKVLDECFAK